MRKHVGGVVRASQLEIRSSSQIDVCTLNVKNALLFVQSINISWISCRWSEVQLFTCACAELTGLPAAS